MNKLRFINVNKPLAPQIKKPSAAETYIDQFENQKKNETKISPVKKNYLEGLTNSEMMLKNKFNDDNKPGEP